MSTMMVEFGTSGDDENSRGMVIGGKTDWILGTNTSLTREVIKLIKQSHKAQC